jgi:flagellar biogenesis protein FliO
LIRVLGSHYLGVKKTISIVQVPGSILVLGISADRINLLERIDDPSLLEELCQHEESKPGLSFKDHLQRFSNPLRSRIQPQDLMDRTELK